MDTRQSIVHIAVLSSSRADFGIYLPLLRKILQSKHVFDLKIIAFGSHLSKFHGHTRDEMLLHGFKPDFEIATLLTNDRPDDISTAYALTALKFADFWSYHAKDFDWVLCLGDRFEMAAAVAAGIPFAINFAHIHGGETTLGAIDNIYRHSITLASKLHFVSAFPFRQKIKELTGTDENTFVTGALSLDHLDELKLLSPDDFLEKWHIDLNKPTILITIHPETVAYDKNEIYALECGHALNVLSKRFQLIITMPNADTNGTIYRNMFEKLKDFNNSEIYLIENFGTQSYFTCMKYCKLMIGNSSSGILEAASFQKYVINLGDRQMGRLSGRNVINVPFDRGMIIEKAEKYATMCFEESNLYKLGNASSIILKHLNKNLQ